ncbi:kinetochore scaffold 1 [Hyla sarda]|uniref:kinetochore scaffold 1 n=1 Tax=Hyla sarda TaxID=327740 RepID=UPI0024C3E500|nr:kinetochore scaffold 1 [Hyla sarda]XP_056402074.1 kinetochore scaffold 1 [Hyla sarda]XP_056402075.1 kinetochore scaffold 1 [Hyla sarda]
MDGNFTSQSSDLTERSHRRRLSSILKAPRSPLKYLGSGNELCQEPAIEKRRTSSRRVSFAETIRVFTPELQATGSADQENEGFGTSTSCSNMNKGPASTCEIAGMDTLLHGPIQAPGHSADWNYSDGTKDRTIFFSSDNDMDMTSSNTIAIHGLIEEKAKKIDTSQFLASLKPQTSEEVVKNKDLQLSTSCDKPAIERQSAVEKKIKFSDFLASLAGDKSKAADDEKENIFLFAPTQDNTGNVTQMFREQDDGLDLTRCHTTNIDSFFPGNLTSTNNAPSQPKSLSIFELSHVKGNNIHRLTSNDQTVFIEDDMDITCSHTTRIGQMVPTQGVQPHTSQGEMDKTVHFNKENEMELTRNSSVFVNDKRNVTSVQGKERFFGLELTTLLPQGEDMDITRSHTTHIRQSCLPQEVQSHTSRNETLLSSDKTIRFDKENEMELTRNNSVFLNEDRRVSSVQQKVFCMDNTTLLPVGEDMDLTCSHTTRIRQSSPHRDTVAQMSTYPTEMASTSDKTIHFDKEKEMVLTRNNSVLTNRNPNVTTVQRKERVFGLELTTLLPQGEDMDMTRSHTTHIRQGCLAQEELLHTCQKKADRTIHFDKENEMELTRNNPNVSTIQRKERVFGLELTTLLSQGEDMDMTRSHTMVIESIPGRSHNQSVKDVTIHQEGEMEMTKVHTGLLTAARKSQSWNKGNPTFESFKDKTLYLGDHDDMDMTRAHTVAIENKLIAEIGNNSVKSMSQNVSSVLINKESIFCSDHTTLLPQGEDMDITRSHTMVIERNPVGSHEQSVKDVTVYQGGDMEMTTVYAGLPTTARKSQSWNKLNLPFESFKNKTLYLGDQDDMDMTRAHTVAIENKLIAEMGEDHVKSTSQNVTSALTKKESVFSLEHTTLLPQGEDMDITRSHTMVIERNPVGSKDQSTSVKDVTIHQVNDMEMKTVNDGLLTTRKSQTWNKVNLPFESFKDKTLYLGDQDDMDMTRTHTVAIENKMIAEMGKDRVKSTSHNVSSALTKKESVSCSEPTTLLPQGEDMDITRSHTMVIERNPISSHDPSTSVKDITLPNSAKRNTISWENDPAHKELKQHPYDITVHQEGDMEMTTVNAGLLATAVLEQRQSQSWNKVNPSFESIKDKTLYLGDQDMDMTRAHTVAIENKLIVEMGNDCIKSVSQNDVCSASVKSHLGKNISRPRSVHDFSRRNYTELDQDMYITQSNTVFIDRNKPGNDLQLPMSARPSLVEGKTLHLEMGKGIDWAVDLDNGNHLEKHTRVSMESPDKTIFLYEQNDMDITRSHTTAIESKALEGAEVINVNTKKPTDRSRTALLTNNNLQLPILSRRSLAEGRALDLEMRKDKGVDLASDKDKGNLLEKTIFLYEHNDMDITRSHTTAIESKTLESAKNQNVNTDQQTNRNAVLEQTNNNLQRPLLSRRSLVEGRTSDLEMGRNTNIDSGNYLEKNIPVSTALQDNSLFSYEQTDMDVTKSHTTAIESKILEDVKTAPRAQFVTNNPQVSVLSRRSLVEERTLALDMKRAKDWAFEKDKGNHLETQAPVSIESQDKTIYLYEHNDMDVTRSHTTSIESRMLESTKAKNIIPAPTNASVTSANMMHSKEEDMDFTKSNTVFIDQLRDRSLQFSDILPKRKSVSYRQKSLAFSDETVRLVCNMEETDLNVPPTEGLMNKSSFDKTVCHQGEMEMTKSHTVAIENKALDAAPVTTPVRVCSPVSSSMTSCDIEQTKAQAASVDGARAESGPLVSKHGVSDNKLGSENGFQDQLLESKSVSLEMTSELRSVKEVDLLSCDPSVLASDSRDYVGPEGPKTYAPPVETLTFDPQKDPEMSPEKKLKKEKGKRVSFQILEKEIVAKDVMSDQVTETFGSQRLKPDLVEYHNKTVQKIEQTSDLIDQVTGTIQATENVEDKSLHKDPQISEMNVSFPEDISSNFKAFGTSQEVKSHRRSVADIRLKIKSLTKKWKVSPHHTAPVSSLIDQLPAASQTVDPSGSVQGLNAELSKTEGIQEKEPEDEQNKATARENLLPKRLSLKVFHPKLPNKRASSTSNVLEPALSSGSGAPPQNNQCSTAFLKTLSVTDDRPCIDEEMLPACPDDQDIPSILQYEVPEGAWEELCEKEALQHNLTVSTEQPRDSTNAQKRVRYSEDDDESQQEKRARRNEDILEKDDAQTTTAFRSSDKSYRSDDPHASKTMEQTGYSSSSSQDSRAGGMSLSFGCSQQSSQMDSQLPWDNGCENTLWQKFQDGTITVQEFFMLLRIHILIQKPRYSERPSKRGMDEEATASEILLDQYVYRPKLQVYEEECHTMYQKIEKLKTSTELQHKPLVQVNSVLWEALRMCSENELMYFGVSLKNMKSLYSKKSKRLAHEEKVSTYTKLLHSAQTQSEQLRTRLREAERLLTELEDGLSTIERETERLTEECRDDNRAMTDQSCMKRQTEIDGLKSQEQSLIRQSLELEERKERALGQLGRLQEEAQVIEKRLEQTSFSEWEMVKWSETEAAFTFLYGCLELSISFGDYIDGEKFNNQPCRTISSVTVESQLEDESAPPSSCLVHRLIFQYVEKKKAFHETYKTQKDLPQLLFDLSLVVSRCRLLGEELEYLIQWGGLYNISRVQVLGDQVRLLFSSSAALAKFELIIELSDSYTSAPLTYTTRNLIGGVTNGRITDIMANVPCGLWYLKRTVKSIYENLLK